MILSAISIAVIGCGPGGMFFLHAMETRRQELLVQNRTDDSAATLPHVTCFERASGPGGLWRAHQPDDNSPSMYAALWTNGPSHLNEFHDYTYDEHFKRPVYVYMPRHEMLGYMNARVTKNCSNFFCKYAKFHHEVVNVEYNETLKKFKFEIKNLSTKEVEHQYFDKCVWAGGRNGEQFIPPYFVKLFADFKGRVIHSSNTRHFEQDVRGKRILMIGGSYSAEDLALQAIKLGAEKIFICTRSANLVSLYSSWPKDKVVVLSEQTPIEVTESGKTILFAEVDSTWTNGYVTCNETETELRDIDTVIFCTGYDPNFSMLDPKLSRGFKEWDYEYTLNMSKSWKMAENPLSQLTGDVEPGNVRYNGGYVRPELYHGMRIDNPNMMFLAEHLEAGCPLLEIDVQAWLLVGYITGRVPVPSAEEMKCQNYQQALREMNYPYLRYSMDQSYAQAVDAIPDMWAHHMAEWREAQNENLRYSFKLLARDMEEGQYPLSIGSYDDLNERGQHFMDMESKSYEHRSKLDTTDKENRWKTFRDYDNSDEFYSVFTGTRAARLEKAWMEIDVLGDSAAIAGTSVVDVESPVSVIQVGTSAAGNDNSKSRWVLILPV